jgi:uncharacterized protein
MSAFRLSRSRRLAALALGLAVFAPAQAEVVISQVYGGGGNSGATYTHDFIELLNTGEAPVDISGWSVQYAATTGSSWSRTVLSGTLQPGQYYLIQQAAGAGGTTALPTPDASGNLTMAASNGKVALVANNTALSGTCPLAGVVDLVGYGTANCFTGSAAAAALTNSTAAIRKDDGCANSRDNAADFATLAPVPRNSASAFASCSGGGVPALSIDDVSLNEGDSGETVFRFTISLNAPAATAVQVDVATSDGSATVADNDYLARNVNGLEIAAGSSSVSFDVQVIGDTTVEPNETFFVTLSNPVGATLQHAIGTGTIRNDDEPPVPELAISSIQGAGIGSSPWLGQRVATVGVVTGLRANGYFVQSAIGDEDGDDTTAEGLFVFTGSFVAPQAVVGNRLRVVGTVTQFARTPHGYALTQLGSASASVLATDQPLPPVTLLGAADLDPSGHISRLGRYQGMRVALPAVQVIGASNSFGDFYVTLAQNPRPFREPGVAELDAVPLPAEKSIPTFDMNPERLRVESLGLLGASFQQVDNGSLIEGMSGIMYYDRGDFSLLLPAEAGLAINGGAAPLPAPAGPEDAFSIAGYNIQDLSGGANVPVDRLRKLSAVFCDYLGTPDIVGLVEIADIPTMQRLAAAINDNEFGDCDTNPGYQAYMLSTSGSQRLGFLVATREVGAGVPRVQVIEVAEEAANDPLVAPDGTSTSGLFDRPPLRLSAQVNHGNGASYPVTVIANHLLSLLSINNLSPRPDSWVTAGNRWRGKRLQQAVRMGEIVEARQQFNPAEPIVLLGDFNAFEFSDGYVDVMGILTGHPAAEHEVLNWADTPLTRALTNLALTVPQQRRYSYVFEGNIQALDHIVVNQALLDSASAELHYVRVNADFAYDNAADPSVPVRSSDHDPALVYVTPATFAHRAIDLSLAIDAPRTPIVAGRSGTFRLQVGNAGPDAARDTTLELAVNAVPAAVQVAGSDWDCVTSADGSAASRLHCAHRGALASAAASVLELTVAPSRTLPQTFLTVQATAGSSGTDANPADNSASATVRVTGKPGG